MATVVGVLHPGEMGAALGAVLRARGHAVLWASEGRSEATSARAAAANLEDVGSVSELVRRSEIVLCVCPPDAALGVASTVSQLDFSGVYIDANAISPMTSRSACEQVVVGGATYVDAGIVGPPPGPTAETRLYLAGGAAPRVAALLGPPVRTIVLDAAPGAASALKMVYAAWTKGTAALLLAVRAAARAHGVEPALLEEWDGSIPELVGRSRSAARSAATKGWRWVGEMEEIAATLASVELPPGFHEAAAEIFRRAPHLDAAELDDEVVGKVIAALLASDPTL